MKTLIEALADAVENNGNINAKVLKAIKSVIAAFDALPAPVVPEGFAEPSPIDMDVQCPYCKLYHTIAVPETRKERGSDGAP